MVLSLGCVAVCVARGSALRSELLCVREHGLAFGSPLLGSAGGWLPSVGRYLHVGASSSSSERSTGYSILDPKCGTSVSNGAPSLTEEAASLKIGSRAESEHSRKEISISWSRGYESYCRTVGNSTNGRENRSDRNISRRWHVAEPRHATTKNEGPLTGVRSSLRRLTKRQGSNYTFAARVRSPQVRVSYCGPWRIRGRLSPGVSYGGRAVSARPSC